ncbi:MAG: hypothetical protein IPM57_08670 [Oligoflexia bacterium]|nr:hypothetical protein [Oligoflexia bacterium]
MSKKILITTLLALLLGCAQNNGSGAISSWQIRPEEISPEGCLNLEIMYKRFKDFPSETEARLSTIDIQSSASPLVATKSAYKYIEGGFTQIVDTSNTVTQAQCSSVTFQSLDGETETYQIKSFDREYVLLEMNEKKQKLMRLVGPQVLREEIKYIALNPCGAIDDLVITAAYQIRWGTPDQINSIPQENVSARMLNILDHSVAVTGTILPGPTSTPVVPPSNQPAESRTFSSTGTPSFSLLSEINELGAVDVIKLQELYSSNIDAAHLLCSPRKGKAVTVDPTPNAEEDNQWNGRAVPSESSRPQAQPRPSASPTPSP